MRHDVAAALRRQGLDQALAQAVLRLAAGRRDEDGPDERAFVLRGVACSASIGGIGMMMGSPPNAIVYAT